MSMSHKLDPISADRVVSVIGDLLASVIAICLGTAIAALYVAFTTPSVTGLSIALLGMAPSFWREVIVLPTLVALLMCFIGAYRRTVFYRTHRVMSVSLGISGAYLVYVVGLYLLVRESPQGRASLVACWAINVALMIGLRQAKLTMLRAEERARPGPLMGTDGRQVLVIGGAGYIGSQLSENLLRSGYRVAVLDNLTYGDRAVRHLYSDPNFRLQHADMRHLENLVQAVRGADTVIHLGAIVGDPACALDNETTVEINLLATRMVRDLCHGSERRRLVFASTCSVYGAGKGISDEKSDLRPVSLYACTKIDSERCLLEADGPCDQVIFRLATVFGLSPRPRFDLVVNLLSAQAFFRKEFVIFNPSQWRPLVHVNDVCRALQLGVEADGALVRNQIFNLGDDSMNFTLGQIGERVCSYFPDAKMNLVEKNADHRDYRVSFSKIRQTLGFQCQHTLDGGIEELQSAFKGGVIADYTDRFYYNLDYLRNEPAKSVNLLKYQGASSEFIARAAHAG